MISINKLFLQATLISICAPLLLKSAYCSSSDARIFTIMDALDVFEQHAKNAQQLATLLTNVKNDITLIPAEELATIDSKKLVKSHPELVPSIDFLLFPKRDLMLVLIDDLFDISTSNCKPTTMHVEIELRAHLDQRPGSFKKLIDIFNTYDSDCKIAKLKASP